MKRIIKCMVLIMAITISIVILTNSYSRYNKVLNRNKELYKNANNLNIVDKDGNISINNKIEEKNTLINSIKEKLKIEKYSDEEIDILIDNIENNNSKIEEEITNLLNTKEELINKKNTLNRQYEVLYEKYKLEQETVIIDNVPTILQYPKYPTGCESVALTILLNYH